MHLVGGGTEGNIVNWKKKRLEELVREFLELIGENPDRDGLKDTPSRVARMWLEELSSGYREDPSTYVKKFQVNEGHVSYGDLVIVKDIPVRSICEHHLLPFYGYAHIAYIPREEVLGFSKFARIINVFAKRLQIQERLTQQVADFLMQYLKPKGLLLVIEAVHTCALVRGVEEPMNMVTIAARGVFEENDLMRMEALSAINELKSGLIPVRKIE